MASKWLESLRAAEEGTKRIWIATGTVLVMTVIVSVWLVFFDLMPGFSPNETQQARVAGSEEESGVTFFDAAGGALKELFGFVGAERDYIIKP